MVNNFPTDEEKLEAAEIWSYRRILRIPWTDLESNKEVLKKMEQKEHFYSESGKKRLEFLGQMRKVSLENLT